MKEKELKEQICDICLMMWEHGWAAANDGNVSARLENGDIIATPTGISKRFVTPERLVKISSAGDILEANGGDRPSSEIKMHLRCYAERPDVYGVVHAHPPTATGFAAADIPLDGYCTIEAVLSLGSVPVTPYASPSTDEVPEAIAPYLAEHDALLLRNHGALTVGADVLTAFYRMETLEQYAKISLVAHLLGGEKEISREGIDKLIALRENYHLTGRHPGYKKYRK